MNRLVCCLRYNPIGLAHFHTLLRTQHRVPSSSFAPLEEIVTNSTSKLMTPSAIPEQRRSSRVRFSSELRARELPRLGGSHAQKRLLEGRIQDISAGGICIVAKRRLKVTQILHCELKIPAVSISVPTLMQVRWIRPGNGQFRIGLQFLF